MFFMARTIYAQITNHNQQQRFAFQNPWLWQLPVAVAQRSAGLACKWMLARYVAYGRKGLAGTRLPYKQASRARPAGVSLRKIRPFSERPRFDAEPGVLSLRAALRSVCKQVSAATGASGVFARPVSGFIILVGASDMPKFYGVKCKTCGAPIPLGKHDDEADPDVFYVPPFEPILHKECSCSHAYGANDIVVFEVAADKPPNARAQAN
jgi:hypothetical protein